MPLLAIVLPAILAVVAAYEDAVATVRIDQLGFGSAAAVEVNPIRAAELSCTTIPSRPFWSVLSVIIAKLPRWT